MEHGRLNTPTTLHPPLHKQKLTHTHIHTRLVKLRHGSRGHHYRVICGLELHFDAHFRVAHDQLCSGVLGLELQQAGQRGGAVPSQARTCVCVACGLYV